MNRDKRIKRLKRLRYWLLWRKWTIWQLASIWPQRTRQKLILTGLMLLAMVSVLSPPALSTSHHFSSDEIGLVMTIASGSEAALDLHSNQLVSVSNDHALLIEGQRYYEAGQLQAALQRWRQFAEDTTAQNISRALGWSYVSIAAQDLGAWDQAEGAISRSFSLLANSDRANDGTNEYWAVQARVLNAQGRLLLGQGQPEAAWEIWTQTEAAYDTDHDQLGSIGAQINQSQALQTMGLYRRAKLQLEAVVAALATQPDSEMKAIALKSLGTVFQTAGSLEHSKAALTESLDIYQQIGRDADVAGTLFALANTLRLMQDSDGAQQRYQAVEALVPGSILHVKSQLNRFNLMLETQQWQQARQLLPSLFEQVKTLPASRQSVYSRVNLTESLLSNRNELGNEPDSEPINGSEDANQPIAWISAEDIATLLREGIQQAQTLEDNRAQAFAIGELSKLYDYTEQWSDSQALAQRALSLSQENNAQDMAYLWQRQLGKAYHHQGKETEAIASYTSAVETLRQVRRDLLATNADVQYSFRETVEPVYRELVSILLLPDDASEQALGQARQAIEELQLAEIENYFKSACVDSTTEAIDNLDTQAAVIYPIVLPDRIEVVLSVPGLPLSHYRTWQTEQKTNQKVSELYRYLNPVLSQNRRLSLSKEIYDWLILPAEETLTANKITTLVFVLDGQFRQIPMAALHDGEQYLLEKYGVALTPGMRLLGPHFQNPKPLQALMLGLTEARGGFAALPGVKTELEQVANRVNAEILFDQDFTQAKLATEIDRIPFPVLHLATHGQFSSDLEETFLLAWDKKISIGDLDNLLRSRREKSEPVELMVLSACQTAEGDDRAALGLAGMAIRSGARSTLATLWSVNDSSTAALMTEFYQELSNTDLTKAEALRRAQIKILQNPEYSHPYYWSPFVLIGNWLS